jgi:hypothetical protein
MNRRKTLVSRHLRSPPRARPGEPNSALDADPIVQAPPQCFRRPLRVMHRRSFLARRSATRRRGRSRPGRDEWSFPHLARRRSWGSTLRRFAPARGWKLISEPPNPPAFCIASPDPIDFRRVGPSPLEARVRDSRRTSLGRIDVGFWVSPVCDPCRGMRGTRAPDGIGRDRSCPGLCLLQGCGHGLVRPRRARTRVIHQPPDAPPRSLGKAHPIRSWALHCVG